LLRNRAFWVALVLFLGLAAWIRYFESRRPTRAPETTPVLLEVEPVSVRAITCTVPPDSTRLEKKDGSWQVTWPVDFPADPVAVEALLSRCRKLEVLRALPLAAGELARFGFSPPRSRIVLELADGGSTTIEIGNPAQASPAFYVRVAGRSEVGLLRDTEVESYFRRRTADWRRPELLLMKAGEIISVDLISGNRRVRLARDDARSPWRVEAPFPGLADGTVVADYCKGLLAMKARAFPDDRPASLAPYGLGAPAATIVVANGSGARCRLDIGTSFQHYTGPLRYARVEGMPNIFGVPPVYVDVARRGDFFFRARRLFHGRPGGLARLQVSAGADSAVLRPDSTGAWRLAGEATIPGTPPPDRRSLVEAWVQAKADSILPAAGPGSRRIDWRRPVAAVETLALDGARERLEIGPSIGDLPESQRWPARLIASNPPRPDEVFLLDSETVRSVLAILRR
jgi:hypothetical protein